MQRLTLCCWIVAVWKEKYCVSAWSYLPCTGPATRPSPVMLRYELLSMQCDVQVLLYKIVHSVVCICGNGWYAHYVQLCIWQWICCTWSVSVHNPWSVNSRHFVTLVSTLGKEGNCVFGSRMMTTKHRMCGHQSWKADCCMILLNILQPTYRESQVKNMLWINGWVISPQLSSLPIPPAASARPMNIKLPWKSGSFFSGFCSGATVIFHSLFLFLSFFLSFISLCLLMLSYTCHLPIIVLWTFVGNIVGQLSLQI